MARPTPYPELNSVLEELVASVKAALGEAFVGAYLQGSFAVGDFDRHSDVDFIIVVSHELGDRQSTPYKQFTGGSTVFLPNGRSTWMDPTFQRRFCGTSTNVQSHSGISTTEVSP